MKCVGRLFLGDGWMVYAGPIGTTDRHAHHSFQLLWSLGQPLLLRGNDDAAVACVAAVVPPDVPHATDRGALETLLVYVDPDTVGGRRLRRVVAHSTSAEQWRAAGEPLRDPVTLHLPATWHEAQACRDAAVGRLVSRDDRTLPLHPGLLRARAWLADHFQDDQVSLDVVAREVGLSRGRLSHLFGEQLGLGLRPLVLWLRLQRAAHELAGGASMTSAAAAAGFADGAHMTRTFRRMFGLAPSDVVGTCEWIVAPRRSE